ncbi:hypothetical protein PVL29_021500 [Vitis rotundifolia]|uniref:Late embryogenesis abundant protein LEA-2 subgroup domain-containing protein n=1 Tax=Vitis rotundifolia TaxID=103349 RepID=A0AA38YZU6_VITRO|nr:hypothetical protein PVL29_021500 [Vitis rotundifolia]
MASKNERVNPEVQSQSLRRKKIMKYSLYAAAFVVFQTIVITSFALTVMRIKNPKFRLRNTVVEDIVYSSNTSTTSFGMRIHAEVTVENTNFGNFTFENSTVTFAYGGNTVGEVFIARARARARSIRKIDVMVDVSSNNVSSNSNLGSELNSGRLMLTSHGRLNGRVQVMKLIKKRKSAQMNCTMGVNLMEREIEDLNCK